MRAQINSQPFPIPQKGDLKPEAHVFWCCRPVAPHVGLASLLLLAGYVKENPGETWMCDICNKQITKCQYSSLCNNLAPHWVHKNCANIQLSIHKFLDLLPTHSINPSQAKYRTASRIAFRSKPSHCTPTSFAPASHSTK